MQDRLASIVRMAVERLESRHDWSDKWLRLAHEYLSDAAQHPRMKDENSDAARELADMATLVSLQAKRNVALNIKQGKLPAETLMPNVQKEMQHMAQRGEDWQEYFKLPPEEQLEWTADELKMMISRDMSEEAFDEPEA